MDRTYTPELDAGALVRLEDYAALFREDFRWERQAGWCGVYLAGLLTDGERKSVEPMSRRVVLPEGLPVSDPDFGAPASLSAPAPGMNRRSGGVTARSWRRLCP